jgi:ABC-type bacteriocin/lantibiotic exporter with double-glycine peptidase domain
VDKELEAQEGIDPFENSKELKIELENVAYTTSDNFALLKDITFAISNNDCILLTGPSGSGKTTLLKLLSGIYFPTEGTLYINNTSIKGVWPNKYRSQVGQVLPEQLPFEGTILENITFGDTTIDRTHLNTILTNVGLLPFIKQQPNGINTMLYPQGQQIPYTVSKRIVLARAIVNGPRLLLLKDPLEYFEYSEAARIIDYLRGDEHPWTIVVASRNPLWASKCTKTIKLTQGTLYTESNA